MPRWLEVAAAFSWRLVVIGIVAVAGLWLVAKLWVPLAAIVIALFLTRILAAPNERLRRRVPPGLAAATTLLAFLALLGAVFAGLGAVIASEVSDIGPTVSRAIDDVADWLVDDSPFDLSRRDVDEFRESFGERVGDTLRDSSGSLVTGAILVAETALSLVLGLIMTFFALKDGGRLVASIRGFVPDHRDDVVRRMGEGAWRVLGGYLRGAALLGVVEGVVIGTTLWLVGAELALPMAVITFLAAFVPFVGAIVAGTLSVLIALATVGLVPALIVLAVAFFVQQFDNDLLAPVVYGRALQMHPVVVLLAITAGGALFGIPGSLLAVPVTAVAWNAVVEARA
ncbi:MAG: AI-2E family transporter [Acidimicrobiia bacterium]